MGFVYLSFKAKLWHQFNKLSRLNTKGSVFVEYATISTIVGVTIIGTLSLFLTNRDNYETVVASIQTNITGADDDTPASPDGDGSPIEPPHDPNEDINTPDPEDGAESEVDENPDEGNHGGDPEPEPDDNEGDPGNCFTYRALGSGYNRKAGILQVKIKGNMIGFHTGKKLEDNGNYLTVKDVSAARDPNQDLLLVIEYNEASGHFSNGDAISVFTFDGSRQLIGKSRLKGGKGSWHQGDNYLVTSDTNLMLSLMSLPMIADDIQIDKREKPLDGNGLFNFSNIGCMSFPDGKAVKWKDA
jgi:Flp pilus assembly pilin Flp